jgi:hypothetical protein
MIEQNISYRKPDGSGPPGLGDGRQRLREQDEDGIDAEVLYPGPGPSFIATCCSRRPGRLPRRRAGLQHLAG